MVSSEEPASMSHGGIRTGDTRITDLCASALTAVPEFKMDLIFKALIKFIWMDMKFYKEKMEHTR
jgi:hypothetical protein